MLESDRWVEIWKATGEWNVGKPPASGILESHWRVECWKATGEWNITVEFILHIRRIRILKNEDQNFWKWSKNFLFKFELSPSKKKCVICFIESPLKMMKNAFYSILKALFVLKISFYHDFLVMQKKTTWLERGYFQNS